MELIVILLKTPRDSLPNLNLYGLLLLLCYFFSSYTIEILGMNNFEYVSIVSHIILEKVANSDRVYKGPPNVMP